MPDLIDVEKDWREMNQLLGRPVIIIDLRQTPSWGAYTGHAPQRYILSPEEVELGKFNVVSQASSNPKAPKIITPDGVKTPEIVMPSDPRLTPPPEGLGDKLKHMQEYGRGLYCQGEWNAFYWLSWPRRKSEGLEICVTTARFIPRSYPWRIMHCLGESNGISVICFEHGIHAISTISDGPYSERMSSLTERFYHLDFPLE
jgi:hypothetical protein